MVTVLTSMPSGSSGSLYPLFRVVNSLVLMTIAMAGMYASIMVLEPATREFGTGRGAGALPYTLYMIGFGLGNIFLGKVMDRCGIAVLALVGSVCLPAGLYLATEMNNLWSFSITLAVLCGFLGGAFAFGPLAADISHWFDRRRGLAVGIVFSGSYIAGAIWPPLIQSWTSSDGWRGSFVNLAIVCAITMAPLSLVYLKKNRFDQTTGAAFQLKGWENPLGMTKSRLQGCLCFGGIGCCVAMSMPQVHIVPYAIDLGFEAQDGAYMLALMLGFGIVSRVLSGWISDRIGGLKTLLLGAGLQVLSIILFWFVDTLTGLYLVSVAFGLSQGGIVPSYTIIIRKYFRPDEAGGRVGLASVATVGGMALGGWLAGALYDLSGSYTLSYLNAIAFNMGTLAIATYLLRQQYRWQPAFTTPS